MINERKYLPDSKAKQMKTDKISNMTKIKKQPDKYINSWLMRYSTHFNAWVNKQGTYVYREYNNPSLNDPDLDGKLVVIGDLNLYFALSKIRLVSIMYRWKCSLSFRKGGNGTIGNECLIKRVIAQGCSFYKKQ